ncbi:AAA family ATPase, partial [Klebsiella pneumoniae]
MVGNRDFAECLQHIANGGGRAVLCGDRDQLLSVAHGAPFTLLQERSPLDTAIMKDIVRQV